MKYISAILTLGLLTLIPPSSSLASNVNDPKNSLTCKKLDSSLLSNASGVVRPFCNPVEVECRAMKFLQERPKNDKFRKHIEPQLARELRYKLDICEIAIRKAHPNAMPER